MLKELCKKHSNCKLIEGHWTDEIDHRNFGLSVLFSEGIDYAFVIDCDEIYSEEDFLRIKSLIAANPQIDAFHIEWNTYWKKSYHVISPRECYKPLLAAKVSRFLFTAIRAGITSVIRSDSSITRLQGPYNAVLIPPHVGICHHLSYARHDARIRRKLEISGHHNEFLRDWYEKVWLAWHPQMRNLHPVVPEQYQIAVESDFSSFPAQLKRFIQNERGTSVS
jgi:glycosyltransferase involved in cell wall biosynthesis